MLVCLLETIAVFPHTYVNRLFLVPTNLRLQPAGLCPQCFHGPFHLVDCVTTLTEIGIDIVPTVVVVAAVSLATGLAVSAASMLD